jgi:endonuclease/exonuclease/phosphatase family metal-dependent hydrolase
MPVVIRSWNVYHGRSHPPDRTLSVEAAVRLAASDHPTILCLQELPVWSLKHVETWSGMTGTTVVTVRPSLGPIPITAEAGRRLVALHPPLFRSAFCGQGNAVLLSPGTPLLEARTLVLNPRSFRQEEARRLGLGFRARLAWARNRRVCQAVRVVLPDGRRVLVASFHASSIAGDLRPTDAEVLRAARFAADLAEPRDLVVLAGDFNARPESSTALASLAREWGFSAPGPGIDHVLVRGAEASEHHAWPEHRRTVAGRLLSDHAPVEVILD